MAEKTFKATDAALNDAMMFVEEELEQYDCPMKAVMQISVCVEEMFVNVAHYAYGEGTGDVTMTVNKVDNAVEISFADSGMPFDPLAKPDPDISLGAEDRNIGGLGIYMVKKSMNEVSYERKDNKNIFKMKKEF